MTTDAYSNPRNLQKEGDRHLDLVECSVCPRREDQDVSQRLFRNKALLKYFIPGRFQNPLSLIILSIDKLNLTEYP